MNTLIYHYGALGDFITTSPVIAALRQHDGDTITFLGKPLFGEFGRSVQLIDTTIDADGRPHRFLFADAAEERASREFFAPFDNILLFAGPQSPLVKNARRFSRNVPLHQSPFPTGSATHIIDYHLSLLPAFCQPHCNIPVIDVAPELVRTCRMKYGIDARPFAVLHPGSGSSGKNWPLINFIEVAGTLGRAGFAVVWLTGPAETTIDLPREDRLIADAPLLECTALCAGCSVYIGNDSGMTHLAAAGGCPVVALFGPSDPAVWAPRGRGPIVTIRHLPDYCAPCHHTHHRLPDCTTSCINAIHPDEVADAALWIALNEDRFNQITQ